MIYSSQDTPFAKPPGVRARKYLLKKCLLVHQGAQQFEIWDLQAGTHPGDVERGNLCPGRPLPSARRSRRDKLASGLLCPSEPLAFRCLCKKAIQPPRSGSESHSEASPQTDEAETGLQFTVYSSQPE